MLAPMATIASCLLGLLVGPLLALLAGRIVPGSVVYVFWLGWQYAFPVNSIRLPNLPAGMQPGPNFRYELGVVPVFVTWGLVVVLFGLVARGLRTWQTWLAAVATIVVVSALGHLVLRSLGFGLQLEFP